MNSTWNVWNGVFCKEFPAAAAPSSSSLPPSFLVRVSGSSIGWLEADGGKLLGNDIGGGSSGENTGLCMVGVVTGDVSSPSGLLGVMLRDVGMRLVSMVVDGNDVRLGDGGSVGLNNGDLKRTLFTVVPLSKPSVWFGKALLIGPNGLASNATDPMGFLLRELSMFGFSKSDERGEKMPAPGRLLCLCCVSALPTVSGLSSDTEVGPFLTGNLMVVGSPPSLMGEMMSMLSICWY